MLKTLLKAISILIMFSLSACQSIAPVPKMQQVDLDRFMGSWYVTAAIPTFIERDPYNPIEQYQKNADGSISTTFTFRQGGFDGPLKRYQPTGYVVPGTGNAEWGMQFLWPFKSEYLIAFVSDDYQHTIIARNKRDYVWLMSRQPHIDDATYQAMVAKIAEMGYNIDKLKRFPHQ